jgi:hypothetical protein
MRWLVAGGWLPAEINPRAADEAGVFIALGRVTNEVGWLVDDQQIVVFVDDGEQFFQTRRSLTTDDREGHDFKFGGARGWAQPCKAG